MEEITERTKIQSRGQIFIFYVSRFYMGLNFRVVQANHTVYLINKTYITITFLRLNKNKINMYIGVRKFPHQWKRQAEQKMSL